ncbi:hypothetical protein [Vibrio cionasavignyae]|uniref:hypothetical protein n=1 Tax=Vibrio cionasavignyae TaxID=2910252 RepID=UPI003D0CB4CE
MEDKCVDICVVCTLVDTCTLQKARCATKKQQVHSLKLSINAGDKISVMADVLNCHSEVILIKGIKYTVQKVVNDNIYVIGDDGNFYCISKFSKNWQPLGENE